MIRNGLLSLLLVVFSFATGCSRDPVVAKVGPEKITSKDLEVELLRRVRTVESAKTLPLESRTEALNYLVDRRLRLMDGKDRKIDQRADIAAAFQEKVIRAAHQELYNAEVRDKVIKKAMLKRFWSKLDEERRVSHILVKLGEKATEAESKAAKARADSIYTVARKTGVDFNKLATDVTQDMTARDGDLGFFKWGRMVDEFQEEVWKLDVGEISKPFKTMYGYHVVKLTEKRKIDRQPFEYAKDEIMRQMMGMQRTALMEQAQKFLDKLNKKYDVVYNAANVQSFTMKLGPSSTTQHDPFAMLSDADKDLVLYSFKPGKEKWGAVCDQTYYKNGKLTARALIEKIAAQGRTGPITDSAMVHALASDVMTEWVLSDYVMAKGITKKKAAIAAAERDTDLLTLSRLDAEVVTDRVSKPTDEELTKFMSENPNRWMTPEKCDLVEVMMADQAAAQKFAESSKKRGKITQAEAKRMTKRAGAKGKEGLLEGVTPTMYGAVGAAASAGKVGEILGPVADDAYWCVFQITKKYPSVPMNLTENRMTIENAYKREMSDRLRKEWMDGLRKKYPVVVNEGNVKKVFGGIQTAAQPVGAPKTPAPRLGQPERIGDPHGH